MPQAFTSGGTGGGGSGTVKSVTAADTSVVVAGTATDPTVATGTLDVIAADHPPAANWSNNAKKITALANGTAASDAAAFGQIPAALPPNGAAGGDLTGTYPNPTLGASGVTAATYGDSTHVAQVAVDAKGRITAASNVASPTSLPPNGTAGGDLSGTYPNPAVKAITETSGPTDLVIGTVTDGQFLKRVGGTLVSAAGGTGTVTSVTAADGSVVVAGTAADPTVRTGTLDAIAAAHAPAANWSNNSHKITAVTAGAAANEAAVYDQTPAGIVTATGDLVVGTGSHTVARVGIGTAGQALVTAGGTAAWHSHYLAMHGNMPDGAIAQTYDRVVTSGTATTLTSGTLRLQGISLPAGVTITSITFVSGGTALVSGTHQLFGIYDDDLGSSSGTARALLRGTNDDTSTAWAGNTAKTLNLTSSYTTTRSGFFYLAAMVAAGTTPVLVDTTSVNANLAALASIQGGNTTDTGLTALPNPAAAPTAATNAAYAYVS